MKDNSLRNAMVAAVMTAFLAGGLAIASWIRWEFDPALFVYAQALVAALALTVYRFVIWSHRPPTMVLYRQALTMLRKPKSSFGLARYLAGRAFGYFALNKFVWKRGINRWAAHWPIMVGCVMALGIVVPLIFGWVWFETPAEDLHTYRVMLFGIPLRTIPVDGIEAFLAFHGLVWASFPVLIGCSVALWRRMKDRGDQATQTFGNDILPLALLLAIAISGILMTLSYSFFGGAMHSGIAILHCFVVCGTLLWLPYSKLFHIPQRTLKFAHMIYEHESAQGSRAKCERCGDEFADQQQVDDLIEIQSNLGYQYKLNGSHYQMICPRCRRSMLVLAQGRHWREAQA